MSTNVLEALGPCVCYPRPSLEGTCVCKRTGWRERDDGTPVAFSEPCEPTSDEIRVDADDPVVLARERSEKRMQSAATTSRPADDLDDFEAAANAILEVGTGPEVRAVRQRIAAIVAEREAKRATAVRAAITGNARALSACEPSEGCDMHPHDT